MTENGIEQSNIEFTLESKEKLVSTASRRFLNFVSDNKFINVDSIRVAFEEALINAIKHGNKCDKDKKVCVSLVADSEKLVITIENEGDGFNYADAMIKLTESQENIYQGFGRGIFLIAMYTDDFYYENNGKRIIMVKNR